MLIIIPGRVLHQHFGTMGDDVADIYRVFFLHQLKLQKH